MPGASGRMEIVDGTIAPCGFQQLTALSAAVALTVPEGADTAMIQAENQQVRWRDDGTNPTATVGMFIPAGQSIWFTGNLSRVKFIEEAPSAKLDVAYYFSG